MRGAGRARGTHGLRKRCPVCRKLRKFARIEGRDSRWRKVGGRWTCSFCLRLKATADSAFREQQIAWLHQRLGELAGMRHTSPAASTRYDDHFAMLRRLQTEEAEYLRTELARERHLDPAALDSALAEARQLLGEQR